MNNEFDWTWKKMAVAQFEVLSLHLSGRTEENHNKHKSQQLGTGLRFEPGTPRMHSRHATYLTVFGGMFCNIP